MAHSKFKLFFGFLSSARGVAGAVLWVAGIVVLVKLGLWQLDRKVWKDEIFAKIAEEQSVIPAQNPFTPALLDTFVPQRLDLRRGRITAFALPNELVNPPLAAGAATAPIALGPRIRNGMPGFHLYAPLVLTGEGSPLPLLVNFGWVAGDNAVVAFAPLAAVLAQAAASGTPIVLDGWLALPSEKGRFEAANFPDQGIWLNADFDQMADYFGIADHTARLVFHATAALPFMTGQDAPEPFTYGHFGLRNEHLNYARFWFTLCALWVVIPLLAYGRSLRSRPRSPQDLQNQSG